VIEKEVKTKLKNYTIRHNETKSIISNNVNINGATDRTSIKIKCHKIYKDNRESLNKRLLPESYFMRNILDLSAVMALGNLKPNINWHSVTVWISLVLNNFIKNRLTGFSPVIQVIQDS